jgi:hypothetical protein
MALNISDWIPIEMAKLTAKSRRRLKPSDFGLPKLRKYPMKDKAHAANALGRVTQQVKQGKISKANAAKVRAKARRVLKRR